MPLKKPKTEKKEANQEGVMTVSGHLKELRNRIFVIFIAFALAMIGLVMVAPHLIMFFTGMGTGYGYQFVVIAPQEMLMQQFRLAVIGALVLASPVIFYEIYAFLRPGLSKGESSILRLALLTGVVFFALGVVFAYFIALPFMLNFLISLNNDAILLSSIKASISVASYLDFVLLMFIIFGAMFEMPLISIVLSRFGLLTPKMMQKLRPYAIILIFILAAFITPPDVVSQVMVAVPMMLLFFLSTFLCRVFYKQRKEKQEAEEEEAA